MQVLFVNCWELILIGLVMAISAVQTMVDGFQTGPVWSRRRKICSTRTVTTTAAATRTRQLHPLSMVRNIDLPECVILYGEQVLFEQEGLLRDGWSNLWQECFDIDTVVVAIVEDATNMKQRLPKNSVQLFPDTVQARTPRDLLTILETVIVQPRPFGGSAGFGRQLPDPERSPLPQHCVVITSTIPQTRAARATGMRVVSLNEEDRLADMVVDSIDFGVDDIATPGSFWLNPPHPRDDEGYRVDPYEMAATSDSSTDRTKKDTDNVSINGTDDLDDDELQAILSDMAPLK